MLGRHTRYSKFAEGLRHRIRRDPGRASPLYLGSRAEPRSGHHQAASLPNKLAHRLTLCNQRWHSYANFTTASKVAVPCDTSSSASSPSGSRLTDGDATPRFVALKTEARTCRRGWLRSASYTDRLTLRKLLLSAHQSGLRLSVWTG